MKVEISVNLADPQEVALVTQFMQNLSDGRQGANFEAEGIVPINSAADAKAAKAADAKAAKAAAAKAAKVKAAADAKAAAAAPAKEIETAYSLEDLREKLTAVVKNNKALRSTIKAELTRLECANVSTLDPVHYDDFYEFLDNL